MKNTFIKTLVSLIFIIGLASCSDDYFDVNTPSGSQDIADLEMKDLLAPVEYNTMLAQYYTETVFGNYAQNFGSYGSGAAGRTQNSGTWSTIYLRVLPNLKAIKAKAQESNSIYYDAIAKVLTAINIGLATDSWDNIPYSQAAMGQDNPYPTFDTQQAIYDEIFSLLDSAITELQDTDTSNFNVIHNDMIYGGNIDQWLRAAYTLKARFQLHLVNKGVVSPNDVLTTIANGFTSNADNFMMPYPDDINNPWYASNVLTRNTGNFYRAPNDQLVGLMNGNSYPFSTISEDPRLSELFVKEDALNIPSPATDPWRGFINGGDGLSFDGQPGNVFFRDGAFYFSANAPLVLITYSEAMFIKAEAAFLANGGNATSTGTNADAYSAYIEGINANMDMLGVDGSAYVSDSSVDVGMGNLMLHNIMREKYIANFLNPETYNDMRRYDFSADVFKDLAVRQTQDPTEEYAGEWFRRAEYPNSERNSNQDNVLSNYQEPTYPVWWDQ